MRFEIRSDIKAPVKKLRPAGQFRKRRTKYPWHDVEIGQHFFVPNKRTSDIDASWPASAIKGSAWVKRSWTEGGVKGTMVWRIA